MTFRFIVMATDSNGVAFQSGPATLPADLAHPGGFIFTPQSTYWGAAAPTVNTGGPATSVAWGPETPLLKALGELFPGDKFGIIKVSQGQTRLAETAGAADWSPNSHGELFDLTTDTIASARAAFEAANGKPAPEVSAVFWIGGTNDAFDHGAATAYADNLTEFFGAVRAEWMHDPAGKIVYSRMTDTPNAPFNFDVRVAQWAVDQSDINAVSFKTIGMGTQADGFHYDASGVISVGRAAADIIDGWF